MEVALSDAYFSGVSWNKAVEFLRQKNDRNILGLSVSESDILWRYFVQQTNHLVKMHKLTEQRRALEETVLNRIIKVDTAIQNR